MMLSPDIYRIIYRLSMWKTKSTRYFSAFSATEAFEDFYHAFRTGHVNSDNVKIHRVEYYHRFADKWFNKTGQVMLDKKLKMAGTQGRHIILTREKT
jgi:hypothetical protein